MGEAARMWMESGFNVLYLLAIWTLVGLMAARTTMGGQDSQEERRIFLWMFALLALGDTGHVGFRVLAYAMGEVNAAVSWFGEPVRLVGLGALSTSITVTLFYMLMVFLWRERNDARLTPFAWFLLFCGAARLVILAFPQNQWGALVPPFDWSLIRNLPLTIQGLGVAALILNSAGTGDDRVYRQIGICVLVSYAFYMPVILLVQRFPLIGMLMIPKTLAYLAAALIGFTAYFQQPEAELQAA